MRIDDAKWPTRDYTYAAWVLPHSLKGWRAIVEIQTPGSAGVEVGIAVGGRIEAWSSGVLRLRTATRLTASKWTHVALTRIGSLMTVYINGVPQRAGRDGTVFEFGNCPALIGVDADLGCAGRLNGYFSGMIEELRIYDCALAASEIRSITSATVNRAGDGVRATIPPDIDTWLVARLATLPGQHPVFDLVTWRGVERNVLGGVWFGAALFLLWIQGAHPGQQSIRQRTLTILLGSIIAILLTILETSEVSWPPPSARTLPR
jgi:hypothetical protein